MSKPDKRADRFFSFPVFLGGMMITTGFALAMWALSGLRFWVCFLIALFAVLVNGWLATWEDEQPGGFNNPE
jgi:hypothetical protein